MADINPGDEVRVIEGRRYGSGQIWDGDPEDVRGYWVITLEGGPATAANLAVALRTMIPRSWVARSSSMADFMGQLVTALERAQFTPAREIDGDSRDLVAED